MRSFCIDLKESQKGERKKAVKYLRSLGYTVRKRKELVTEFNYLITMAGFEYRLLDYSYDFIYIDHCPRWIDADDVLVLPKDWDKLISLTAKTKPDTPEEEKTVDAVYNTGDFVRVIIPLMSCWDTGIGDHHFDAIIIDLESGLFYDLEFKWAVVLKNYRILRKLTKAESADAVLNLAKLKVPRNESV